MKVKIDSKEKKDFEPFDLNITIESVKEARLFYHVFNRLNLKNAIFDSASYKLTDYNDDIHDDFSGGENYSLIESELKKQGFEV